MHARAGSCSSRAAANPCTCNRQQTSSHTTSLCRPRRVTEDCPRRHTCTTPTSLLPAARQPLIGPHLCVMTTGRPARSTPCFLGPDISWYISGSAEQAQTCSLIRCTTGWVSRTGGTDSLVARKQRLVGWRQRRTPERGIQVECHQPWQCHGAAALGLLTGLGACGLCDRHAATGEGRRRQSAAADDGGLSGGASRCGKHTVAYAVMRSCKLRTASVRG